MLTCRHVDQKPKKHTASTHLSSYSFHMQAAREILRVARKCEKELRALRHQGGAGRLLPRLRLRCSSDSVSTQCARFRGKQLNGFAIDKVLHRSESTDYIYFGI